jgi:uncharacterized protein YdcH (DUF465 family)
MHDGPHRPGRGHGHHHHDQSPDLAQRHKRDQAVFHELLRRHDAIRREVENIDGGIRAVTSSDDPEIAGLIRGHVHEMHRRLQEGFALRHWDPAFVEIFAQKDKVEMRVTDTEDGVVIEEVSDDPNVARLIQAHGVVVTSFVNSGGRAASQPSPLPDDYVRVAS